ncbi:MAG: RDD family protein [Arenicella sp.]
MLAKPGLFIRLLVIIYDGLLLAGVIFASYAILFSLSLLLPENINEMQLIKTIKFIILLLVSFVFYGWFWVNGGQTLGMRAWHLYLVNEHGKFISWRQAAIRYLCAALSWATVGLGFSWILISKDKSAWHDTISDSFIVKHKPAKS